MAINEMNVQTTTTKSSKPELGLQHAYVEPGVSHPSLDVLRQFEANMATLDDLNGRLRFMMTEIRGLIK
jgi:hypothetical protein